MFMDIITFSFTNVTQIGGAIVVSAFVLIELLDSALGYVEKQKAKKSLN